MAVFATSPVPEAANDSAAAASARRSSAEGSVTLRRRVKRRLRGAQQSLEVCHCLFSRPLTFVPKTGSRRSGALGRFSQLYLVRPQSQLVARRPKVPLATSHTFRLFSLYNIHFYGHEACPLRSYRAQSTKHDTRYLHTSRRDDILSLAECRDPIPEAGCACCCSFMWMRERLRRGSVRCPRRRCPGAGGN